MVEEQMNKAVFELWTAFDKINVGNVSFDALVKLNENSTEKPLKINDRIEQELAFREDMEA